jgi:hypothetical protein
MVSAALHARQIGQNNDIFVRSSAYARLCVRRTHTPVSRISAPIGVGRIDAASIASTAMILNTGRLTSSAAHRQTD